METIKEALTFDDVLLLPQYSSIIPAKTNINVSYCYLNIHQLYQQKLT